MKRISLLIYIVFLSVSGIRAQLNIEFNNYQSLTCSGEIPEDFKIELDKYVQDAQNSQNSIKKDKAQNVKYAEISNHSLNNLLYSGKVLYGDPLSQYVNKVADAALIKDKELRKQLRFYIMKSSVPNAYATQRGVIFITMGLLAQLESEAQLAFVICHEAIHFKNNHNIESYKRNQNNSGRNKNDMLDDRLDYSKENELEADREGFKLFVASPYGTKEINKLFDVLMYSYLPFDEIKFDSSYFNTNFMYKLPGKYFLNKVADITAEEDVADSMSTHPNIKRRKHAIIRLIEEKGKSDGVSFFVSKDDFLQVLHAARCELAIIHLQEIETEDALYTAYLLEKHYGMSLFIEKIKSAALYMMAVQKSGDLDRFKNSKPIKVGGKVNETTEYYYDNIEGQSQSVYYFSYNIPASELMILAAQMNYFNYIKYKDEFFAKRFNSLLKKLIKVHKIDEAYFNDYLPSVDTVDIASTDSLDNDFNQTGKVKRIKQSRSVNSNSGSDYYYKYAFAEHTNDSMYTASMDACINYVKKQESQEKDPNHKKYVYQKNKLIMKNGFAFNSSKLAMINPFYTKYNITYYYGTYRIFPIKVKDPDFSPLKEVQIEKQLRQTLIDQAKLLNLDLTILGNADMNSMNTNLFNDYQQLMTWLSERLSIGTIDAIGFNDDMMKTYADKFAYLGTCFVYNADKKLNLTFILLDLYTGEIVMIYEIEKKSGKPNSGFVKSQLNKYLKQVRTSSEKLEKLKAKYQVE